MHVLYPNSSKGALLVFMRNSDKSRDWGGRYGKNVSLFQAGSQSDRIPFYVVFLDNFARYEQYSKANFPILKIKPFKVTKHKRKKNGVSFRPTRFQQYPIG